MFAYEWSDLAQGKKSLYIFSYWLKTVLEFAKIEHLMYGPIRHCFVIRIELFLEDLSLSPGLTHVYCKTWRQFTQVVCILIASSARWK